MENMNFVETPIMLQIKDYLKGDIQKYEKV